MFILLSVFQRYASPKSFESVHLIYIYPNSPKNWKSHFVIFFSISVYGLSSFYINMAAKRVQECTMEVVCLQADDFKDLIFKSAVSLSHVKLNKWCCYRAKLSVTKGEHMVLMDKVSSFTFICFNEVRNLYKYND